MRSDGEKADFKSERVSAICHITCSSVVRMEFLSQLFFIFGFDTYDMQLCGIFSVSVVQPG